jgi:hypothetical protein
MYMLYTNIIMTRRGLVITTEYQSSGRTQR